VADNVGYTPGSGATIATDERTISGQTVHVQRMTEIASTAIVTGQVSIGTTGAQIVGARDTRRRIVLVNDGSADAFVGGAGVTTATGVRLAPGASMTLQTTAAVHAVTASGTTPVHYWEEYDA
jgi:hypothetical protein